MKTMRMKTMRMKTKLSIVTPVGVGALLLAALAIIVAPRAQIAHAQTMPSVVIHVDNLVVQGETATFRVEVRDLPRWDDTNRPQYQIHIKKGDRDKDSECGGLGIGGGWRNINIVYANPKVLSNAEIKSSCPPGDYEVEVSIKYGENDEVVSETADFKVIVPPPYITTDSPTITFVSTEADSFEVLFHNVPSSEKFVDEFNAFYFRTEVYEHDGETIASECQGSQLVGELDALFVDGASTQTGTVRKQAEECTVVGSYKLKIILLEYSGEAASHTVNLEVVSSTSQSQPNPPPSGGSPPPSGGSPPPSVVIFVDNLVVQGETATVQVEVRDLPQWDDTNLSQYQIHIKKGDGDKDSECGGVGIGGGWRNINIVYANPKVLPNAEIKSSCPPGDYEVEVSIKYGENDQVVSETADFKVIVPPPYITTDSPTITFVSTEADSFEVLFHNVPSSEKFVDEFNAFYFRTEVYEHDGETIASECQGSQLVGELDALFVDGASTQTGTVRKQAEECTVVGSYKLKIILLEYSGEAASHTVNLEVVSSTSQSQPNPPPSGGSPPPSGGSPPPSGGSPPPSGGSPPPSGGSPPPSGGSPPPSGGSPPPSGGSPPPSGGYVPRSQLGSQAPLAITLPAIMNVRSGRTWCMTWSPPYRPERRPRSSASTQPMNGTR